MVFRKGDANVDKIINNMLIAGIVLILYNLGLTHDYLSNRDLAILDRYEKHYIIVDEQKLIKHEIVFGLLFGCICTLVSVLNIFLSKPIILISIQIISLVILTVWYFNKKKKYLAKK